MISKVCVGKLNTKRFKCLIMSITLDVLMTLVKVTDTVLKVFILKRSLSIVCDSCYSSMLFLKLSKLVYFC